MLFRSNNIPRYFENCARSLIKDSLKVIDQENVVDTDKLMEMIEPQFLPEGTINKEVFEDIAQDEGIELLGEVLLNNYEKKKLSWNEEEVNYVEKAVALQMVDRNWTKHIDTMAKLREAIYLRSYANTNPLQAYTNEGYEKFEKMIETIGVDIVKMLLHVQIRRRTQEELDQIKRAQELAKRQAEEQAKLKEANANKQAETPAKPEGEKINLRPTTAGKKATIISDNEDIMTTLLKASNLSMDAINPLLKKENEKKEEE